MCIHIWNIVCDNDLMILKFHLQSMFVYRDTKLGERIFIGLRDFFLFQCNNQFWEICLIWKKQSGIEISINCHFWLWFNGKVDKLSTIQDWLENKNGTFTDLSFLEAILFRYFVFEINQSKKLLSLQWRKSIWKILVIIESLWSFL